MPEPRLGPWLAALLWLLAGPACAADLWDRLGPERIGATPAEVAVPMQCSPSGTQQVCAIAAGESETFAGISVRSMELHFVQEQLVWVSVTLGERHYAALLSFLSARFGASDDRTFRARGGMAAAEFEAGVHLWHPHGVSLVLEQFAGKIDRSRLTYGSQQAMADLVRGKTSYPRGARRDL